MKLSENAQIVLEELIEESKLKKLMKAGLLSAALMTAGTGAQAGGKRYPSSKAKIEAQKKEEKFERKYQKHKKATLKKIIAKQKASQGKK